MRESREQGMKPINILGEIKKRQTILGVTRSDLMRVTGWSPQTYARRMAKPDRITLGELAEICNYLGIKQI